MLQAVDYDMSSNQLVLQSSAQQTQLSLKSRPNTPENDLLDEPPSILASRIIRAQDNPSPPPTVSPITRTTSSDKYRLIDVSEPATPFCPASSPANLTSLMSPTWGLPPVKLRYIEEVTPSRDLITFDVGNMPETTPEPPSSRKAISLSDLKVAETEIPEANQDHSETLVDTSPDRQHNNQATLVTSLSNSDTRERSNIDPLSTPVRSTNPKARSRQQHDQLTTSEDLPEKQFSVEAIQVTDTAFKESGGASRSSHYLAFAADRQQQTRPPLPTSSPSKNPHPSRSFKSNEFMPTSPAVPSLNFPSTFIMGLTDAGSPIRNQSGHSSQPPSVADPPQTPARRILIEEAPLSHTKFFSTLSKPGKSRTGSNLGFPRTPVSHIPTTGSPARRMLVPETNSSHNSQSRGTTSNNPTRPHNRSQSAEPSFPKVPHSRGKGRFNSVEPLPAIHQSPKRASTFFKSLASTPSITKVNKLPFPLVPEAILEEISEDQSRPIAPQRLALSSTSTLKHGNSRIPRIGTKPYSRPTTKRTIVNTLPGVLISNAKLSQKSSEPPSSEIRRVKPPTNLSNTVNELAIGLKRKRSYDDTSIPGKTPATVLPVKPVTLRAPGAVASKHMSLEETTKVPQQSDIPSNTVNPISLPQRTLAGDDRLHKNNQDIIEVECVLEQTSPTGRQEVSSQSELTMDRSGTHSVASESRVEGNDEPASNPGTRRTTRVRRKVQPTASAPSSRSSQSRRKAGKAPAPDVGDVFSGMTAVALKTLTNANTVRNQQYLAAKLETEVIRKSGCRPTSPTVKVRTVLQRAQEEKGRSRRERAQRRAQGTGTLQSSSSEEPDELELPTFPELDLNPRTCFGSRDGHRRGAGEDEDYKTPERQLKRLRLTDDPDLGEIKEGRRVKWDRGLFTTVYIDDVQLGTRSLSKVPDSRKGCLALASKVVRLDTMGNLPNANTAVGNLVEENIIIKKYIYDDDEEATPPVVKATRSKSRKSKS